jgi:hypothetical protein
MELTRVVEIMLSTYSLQTGPLAYVQYTDRSIKELERDLPSTCFTADDNTIVSNPVSNAVSPITKA